MREVPQEWAEASRNLDTLRKHNLVLDLFSYIVALQQFPLMELVEAVARTTLQHHPRGIMREEVMTVMEARVITTAMEVVVTTITVALVAAVITDTAVTLIGTTAEVVAVDSW